jgi:hypothetical protein
MSQVPLPIFAINSTLPDVTVTFQIRPVVKPFKSGDEISVNTALALSQVENTCPIRLYPLLLVIQYSNIAEHPKSVPNVSIVVVVEILGTDLVLTLS